MPFLNSQGSFKPGRGFFAAGTIPGAPTFSLNPAIEADVSIPVTFIAPAFNGRISNNWLQVCSFNFC